jgi:hypothetical protein
MAVGAGKLAALSRKTNNRGIGVPEEASLYSR